MRRLGEQTRPQSNHEAAEGAFKAIPSSRTRSNKSPPRTGERQASYTSWSNVVHAFWGELPGLSTMSLLPSVLLIRRANNCSNGCYSFLRKLPRMSAAKVLGSVQ